MIDKNILKLRKVCRMSQEDVAEKIGVSRQTIAKWENGESVPDVISCGKLADLFDVSLDDLVNYSGGNTQFGVVPPKGKYMFGVVTVGERGQIVIPVKARKIFDIKPGDDLLMVGDIAQGLAIVKSHFMLDAMENMNKSKNKAEEN